MIIAVLLVCEKTEAVCQCLSGCDAGRCVEVVGPPPACEPKCENGYEASFGYKNGCVQIQCSCGNVTNIYCCPGTPPGPNPPTATPVQQPTEIITPPVSSVTTQSAGSSGQQWVCLQADPCLNNAQCLEQSDHRTRISASNKAELKPTKKIYIFECLALAGAYRCTTGIADLDQRLIGTEYLTTDLAAAGYQFLTFVDSQNQFINQNDPNQVKSSDDNGSLGPFEWESRSTNQVKRVFYAMTLLPGTGDANKTNPGTQQQATFTFSSNEKETVCVRIQWDPHGMIFDSQTLQPLKDIKITVLKKQSADNFTPLTSREVLGSFVNPQITKPDGRFSFLVPDGIYQLKVENTDYILDKKFQTKKIANIYHGEEIITQGKLELRNIPMRKKTISEKISSWLESR